MTFSTKPIDNPEVFNNWVAQVELVANHFKRKNGVKPTHINVLDPKIAEQLAELYDGQYKFVLGGCLANELRLGVPQNKADAGKDDLKQWKETGPEDKQDQPPFHYDNESATVTVGNIRILDVNPEDVITLAKDPSYLSQMMEEYDWEKTSDKVTA
jgi:hypothetical protein